MAEVIISLPKELRRKYHKEVKLGVEFVKIMKAVNEGVVSKNSVLQIYVDGHFDLNKYKIVSSSDLELEVKAIIDKNKGAPFNALMGEVMKKFKGAVDGKKAAELIKKCIK